MKLNQKYLTTISLMNRDILSPPALCWCNYSEKMRSDSQTGNFRQLMVAIMKKLIIEEDNAETAVIKMKLSISATEPVI